MKHELIKPLISKETASFIFEATTFDKKGDEESKQRFTLQLTNFDRDIKN